MYYIIIFIIVLFVVLSFSILNINHENLYEYVEVKDVPNIFEYPVYGGEEVLPFSWKMRIRNIDVDICIKILKINSRILKHDNLNIYDDSYIVPIHCLN